MNMKTSYHLLSLCLVATALCVSEAALAQTSELDSLERVAANSSDTLRLNALIRLGQRARMVDLNRSIEVLTKARDEAEKAADTLRRLKAINSLGISYGMKEDYANSMEQFKLALAVYKEQGNLMGMADSYTNLGIVYKSIGDYPRSLEAYLQSLQLFDTLKEQSGRSACFHNIGVTYDMMGEMDKALEYFQKALQLNKTIGNEEGRSLNLYSIALVYDRQKKYEEALKLLFEHLDLVKQQNDQVLEASVLSTIGKIYLATGAYEAAATYLHQGRDKSLALGLQEPLALALYNLAELHLKKKDPATAISLLKQQLEITTEINSLVLQKQGHDLIAEAYAQNEDYRNAYIHEQLAAALRDSLFMQDKTQAFQQWQARLNVYDKNRQLEEKEQELQLLEDRARADRRLRWALLAALLLAGFSAVLFYQRYRFRQQTNETLLRKNELIEIQKAEIEATSLELEKRMLRAQINPHFIFNSLGAIQHFITANDRASALKYLSKFSSLLRQVLEDSITNIVVLEEEIQLLKIYLELEALRFDSGFSYEVDVQPELDTHTTEVPLLLIQPFVENAILHGLMPKQGERKLRISFSTTGTFTTCRITDNGIGRKAAAEMKAQKSGSRPSRGMELTRKRLDALNKNSEAQTLVFFNDLFHDDGSAAGTEVIIQIPGS